jgi:hypothetical protein
MALPSSGPISFNDCLYEFAVVGSCFAEDIGGDLKMSSLALAQNPFYSYGNTIYMSGFYGSACPKGGK